MSEISREVREVSVVRTASRTYKATSAETGSSIEFGQAEGSLTPVELLLLPSPDVRVSMLTLPRLGEASQRNLR